MKRKLVIAALVITVMLVAAVPVLAGPEDACNAEQLHGLFGQFAPPVVFTVDTAFFPVLGFDSTTVLVGLTSGTVIVIDYDEGPQPFFPGFQCTTEPPGIPGAPSSDDTIVHIQALPPLPL